MLANELNNCMCEEDLSAPFFISVRNEHSRSRKSMRAYSEVASSPLKKFATHQAIAAYDAALQDYMRPASVTLQRYADALDAN